MNWSKILFCIGQLWLMIGFHQFIYADRAIVVFLIFIVWSCVAYYTEEGK